MFEQGLGQPTTQVIVIQPGLRCCFSYCWHPSSCGCFVVEHDLEVSDLGRWSFSQRYRLALVSSLKSGPERLAREPAEECDEPRGDRLTRTREPEELRFCISDEFCGSFKLTIDVLTQAAPPLAAAGLASTQP